MFGSLRSLAFEELLLNSDVCFAFNDMFRAFNLWQVCRKQFLRVWALQHVRNDSCGKRQIGSR